MTPAGRGTYPAARRHARMSIKGGLMTTNITDSTGPAEDDPVQFATPDDLEKRWAGMPAGAKKRANVLLEDASQFILDTVPTARSAKPATLRRITCAVVRRFMESELSESRGLTQQTVGAGPYQETQGFHNPDGSFYLRGDEKHALGHGRQRAGNVDLLGGFRD